MYAATTFVLLFLALCVQEFIPRLGAGASYGLILLFPVCFLCMAVTLPYSVMLGLAFFAGILWDLRYTVDPGMGITGVWVTGTGFTGMKVTGADGSGMEMLGVTPFGISILFFGLLGSMMHGVHPLYRRNQMVFPVLLTGVGIFAFRLMDYLFLNFKRGNLQFPTPVFREICATALISMVLSPLIYFVLYWLAKLLSGMGLRHGLGRG